jgi:hypothetical protein
MNPDEEDEKWQFSTGDVVKCESRLLAESVEYKRRMIAVEKIEYEST